MTGQVVGAEAVSRWLPNRARVRPVDFPVFCLPHAGGSASAFSPWIDRIPGIGVLSVQPPGRETRLADPAFTDIAPLVAELADVVVAAAAGRPYGVYGHSHGALIGFELLRELRRRQAPLPVGFVASGCPAPHLRGIEVAVSRMSRRQVVAMLRKLGGTPEWLLQDEGALDMILPPFVADFTVRERYHHDPEPPLSIPFTVIAAAGDKRAAPRKQARWQELTTGPFRLHTTDGGHFAVFENAPVTHRLLAEAFRVGP